MSSRPPNVMVNSSIGNSGLLITRTLHRHKHQLRDFFNRHACFRKLTFAVTLEGSRCGEVNVECSQCLIHGVYDTQKRCCEPSLIETCEIDQMRVFGGRRDPTSVFLASSCAGGIHASRLDADEAMELHILYGTLLVDGRESLVWCELYSGTHSAWHVHCY